MFTIKLLGGVIASLAMLVLCFCLLQRTPPRKFAMVFLAFFVATGAIVSLLLSFFR